MIKRKTILSIFILIFLTINLVGCKNLSQQTKEDIYEDFQKKITKNISKHFRNDRQQSCVASMWHEAGSLLSYFFTGTRTKLKLLLPACTR